ncbi:MAG: glycosyltransferase [Magnetospirillum sp. WYHS-4]
MTVSRQYRLVRFTPLAYAGVERMIRDALPNSATASYETLHEAYCALSPLYSDTVPRELRRLGNETFDFVGDSLLLQGRWAMGRNIPTPADPRRILREIALAQLRETKPDVLYLQGANHPFFQQILTEDLRDQVPSLKLVVGYVGIPMARHEVRHVDCLIACAPAIRETFLRQGRAAEMVYYGFDPAVDDRLSAWRAAGDRDAEIHAFTFVGKTGFTSRDVREHLNRYWDLLRLMFATGLEVWADEDMAAAWIGMDGAMAEALRAMVRDAPAEMAVDAVRMVLQRRHGIEDVRFPIRSLFPERCHDAVYGLPMYDLLARSRISFNRHVDIMTGCAGNMRMFEATAMGTCLMTEAAANMPDLFEADREVVTYRSVDEAIDKARYLLDHPMESEAIARAGRERTLRDHSLVRRTAEIHEIIAARLA